MSDQKALSTDCPFRPPAPTPPTEIRNLFELLRKAKKDLLTVFTEGIYNDLMGRRRFGFRDVFIVNAPDAVREILNTDADNYPKSNQMVRALHPLVGNGIFISNGETWRRRRGMVNPALGNVRLRIAFPMMQAAIDDMLNRFTQLPPGAVVNLDAEMAHVTADIMFRAIFSKELTQEVSRDIFDAFSVYQEALPQFDFVEMLGFPSWMPRGSMRKARKAAARIRGSLRTLITERLQETDRQSSDILSVLIESRDERGQALSLEELVDEVSVLFLAGHETSATALTWAVYLASEKVEVAQRLYEEANTVFSPSERRFEDVSRLVFAQNVFKESLRLYPPVSFITREAIAERWIRRERVRKRSMMVISPWVIQRHRKFWRHPDCFVPDRYQDEDNKKTEKKAFLPFGAGQRACPGASFAMMEGPLILANLFYRFDVNLQPGVKPYPVSRLTTRPKDKISVQFRPRTTP